MSAPRASARAMLRGSGGATPSTRRPVASRHVRARTPRRRISGPATCSHARSGSPSRDARDHSRHRPRVDGLEQDLGGEQEPGAGGGGEARVEQVVELRGAHDAPGDAPVADRALLRELDRPVAVRDLLDPRERERDVMRDAGAPLGGEQPRRAVDEHGRRALAALRPVRGVDHDVHAGQRLVEALAAGEVHRAMLARPLRGRAPGEHPHRVPGRHELGHHVASHRAGPTGHRQHHRSSPSRSSPPSWWSDAAGTKYVTGQWPWGPLPWEFRPAPGAGRGTLVWRNSRWSRSALTGKGPGGHCLGSFAPRPVRGAGRWCGETPGGLDLR